jgi:hypothetical protein
MFNNNSSERARIFELEQELVSAKADLVVTKTLRTKLGSSTIEWITSVASAVVLLAMALSAIVSATINTVALLAELVISTVLSIEIFVISVVKMIETMFIACATVWAIIGALLEDFTKIDVKQSYDIAPPPPSQIPSPPPSPPSPSSPRSLSGTEIVSIFEIYKETPYANKEQKRDARIKRRALRAHYLSA